MIAPHSNFLVTSERQAHFPAWLREGCGRLQCGYRPAGVGGWNCKTSGGIRSRGCEGCSAGSVKAARVTASPGSWPASGGHVTARLCVHARRLLPATAFGDRFCVEACLSQVGAMRAWRVQPGEGRATSLVRSAGVASSGCGGHHHPARPGARRTCEVSARIASVRVL